MAAHTGDDLVRRARVACAAAHAGQKRDNGADYATHPHAVACTLKERELGDAATLAAAYLHDVLEDTATNEADLVKDFGAEIAALVKELTNIGSPNRTFAGKQAALLHHARRMSPRAKLIKLADRLHNLTEMALWPDGKQRRYARATLELLDALVPWPDDDLAEELERTAVACLERLDAG